jgi:thiol-disulfide isomerase/thioredoxin
MKKVLSAMFLLLPVFVAAQKGYTINGKLPALKGTATAYLSYGRGDQSFTDSTEVKNGKFQFKGSVVEPAQAFLTVTRDHAPYNVRRRDDHMAFYIENSKITITGTDSIQNATVKGSQADKEYKELDAMVMPYTKKIIHLQDAYHGKPKDEAYKRAGDSVAAYVAEIKAIRRKFAMDHLNTYMGLNDFYYNVLDSYFKPVTEEPLFHQFSAQLQASPLGKMAEEKINVAKRRQANAQATDFTQNDVNGNPFTLSSLRGKFVLVDFWASWCVPCRAENPNVRKAYKDLKGKNFEIVSVSLDMSKEPWVEAIKKDTMPWIHVCDMKGWKNDVATLYGINSVPQNLLINPEGKIVATNLRGEDLTQKLLSYINK